jgi:sugar (pentulose or hexulose) kinase
MSPPCWSGPGRLVKADTGPLLLGVDLGTTAIKGGLHALDGAEVATAAAEYELLSPAPAIVEVPAAAYWQAFTSVVHALVRDSGVDRGRIKAIGISAQGETLLPVSSDGAALRNAIVWLDNRAQQESAELDERFGQQCTYDITGQPGMLPTWPAAKVLWLARNEPQTFARAARFLLLEDYFITKLTGEEVCEGSLVTSTCYWNFRAKQWWPEMLAAIGISSSQLPQLVEPGTAIGSLRPAVAAELGLDSSTLVCAGALDQACGAIGVGNVRPGVLSENTGTAVALCATLDGARLDPQLRMLCHYHGVPDSYMFHTFTTGGLVLRWFRDNFCEQDVAAARASGADAYGLIAGRAAAVPPGADGLVILPHLQGAMAPDANPDARGVMIGLALHHGRDHIARALLESVAFVIRRNVEVLDELGIQVESILASGGGARSAVWKQIEADVTGVPVQVTTQTEAATLGACILAGHGAGFYSSVPEAAESMVKLAAAFEPDAANKARYDDTYAVYRAATTALGPVLSLRAKQPT